MDPTKYYISELYKPMKITGKYPKPNEVEFPQSYLHRLNVSDRFAREGGLFILYYRARLNDDTIRNIMMVNSTTHLMSKMEI